MSDNELFVRDQVMLSSSYLASFAKNNPELETEIEDMARQVGEITMVAPNFIRVDFGTGAETFSREDVNRVE